MKLAITKKPMSIAWTMSSRLFCTNPVLPELDELQVNKCWFLFPATIFFLFFVPTSPCKGRDTQFYFREYANGACALCIICVMSDASSHYEPA